MSNYEKLYKLSDMKDADCEKHEGDCLNCLWSASLPHSTLFNPIQAEYKSDGKLSFCDLIEWGTYDE